MTTTTSGNCAICGEAYVPATTHFHTYEEVSKLMTALKSERDVFSAYLTQAQRALLDIISKYEKISPAVATIARKGLAAISLSSMAEPVASPTPKAGCPTCGTSCPGKNTCTCLDPNCPCWVSGEVIAA